MTPSAQRVTTSDGITLAVERADLRDVAVDPQHDGGAPVRRPGEGAIDQMPGQALLPVVDAAQLLRPVPRRREINLTIWYPPS